MPLTAPAGLLAECKKGVRQAEIVLVDIETYDGTQLFWSDAAYTVACALDATVKTYSPWVKSAGPFRRSKNLATDAGDIMLQNLSGNLLDRDLGKALRASEFEGALAIVRFLIPLADIVTDEYHGTLSEQGTDQVEGTFRHLQLLDLNVRQQPIHDFQVKCPLTFKSDACGSAGAAVSCNKTMSDCQHASRAAQERHQGIPLVPPESIAPATLATGVNGGVGAPPGTGGGLSGLGVGIMLGALNRFGGLPIEIPVVPKMLVK